MLPDGRINRQVKEVNVNAGKSLCPYCGYMYLQPCDAKKKEVCNNYLFKMGRAQFSKDGERRTTRVIVRKRRRVIVTVR